MPTLDFKGKQHIYAHHLSVPYRQLIPDESKSVSSGSDSGNLIIHGDNLHALKALLPTYAGKVKCIYIDPPYNTGNEGWIYNDRVNSPLMRQWLTENRAVDGEDLERHDKWLCMMWPRLQLLRELLSEDGAIFVSIDDNEQHHLRMIMDEIFGETNFVANFVWHHRKSSQNDIDVSLSHNHVVCYAFDGKLFQFNAGDIDESRFSNPDNDPRGDWVADPMDAPNVRENLTYEIVNPNTGAVYLPPTGRCWRFSMEKFQEALRDDRVLFGRTGRTRPQYKRFLTEARERGKSVSTIWSDVGTAANGTRELMSILGRRNDFPTPKPVSLIERIVKISTGPDDIILDSFAGSGTTAQAVLQLNAEDGGSRRFVLVESESYSDDITAERVRRVINGVSGARNRTLREGFGGEFTYCILGDEIGIESMLRGENLPDFGSLAAYLLYCSTGVAVDSADIANVGGDGFFYETERVRYHMFYEPEAEWLRGEEGALNYDRAKGFSDAARDVGKKAVVFAPVKFVSHEDILSLGITFCQLPYELTASRAQALEM